MKKLIYLLVAVTLLTGCSTIFKEPDNAYDTGSYIAMGYVVTRGYIPEEERETIRELYLQIKAENIYAISNEFITNMVIKATPNLEDKYRESMIALFIEAREALVKLIVVDPSKEQEISDAFFKGVEDKLQVHNIVIQNVSTNSI